MSLLKNKALNHANFETTFVHSASAMDFLFKRAESVRATVDVIIMCYCSLRYQRVGLRIAWLPEQAAEIGRVVLATAVIHTAATSEDST